MRSVARRALVALAILLVPVVGGAEARAARTPTLDVEQYPLSSSDPSTAPWIFVADGGVWSVSGDDVRRVDPATEPLVGYLTPATFGPYVGGQVGDATLWRLMPDPDAAPCASPRPEEDPERPLSLR